MYWDFLPIFLAHLDVLLPLSRIFCNKKYRHPVWTPVFPVCISLSIRILPESPEVPARASRAIRLRAADDTCRDEHDDERDERPDQHISPEFLMNMLYPISVFS